MTAPDKDGWITYRPGDPIPRGNVRIRHEDGWESYTFAPAHEWVGWDAPGVIVAYLPESPPQETEADRIARCAPQLVEALISTTASLVAAVSLLERGGKRAAASDKMFAIMLDDYRKSIEQARQALSEARIEL